MMRNPWGRCPGRPKKFRALTRRLCLFLSLLFGILLYSFVLSSIGGVRDDAYWVTLPHVIRAEVGDEVKITLDGWNSKVQLTEGKEDYPTIRIHATPSDFAKQTKFKTIKSGSQTEVQVEVPSRWKFWSNEAIVEVQAPRNGIRLVSNKKVELRAPSVRHIDVFGDYAQIVQPSDAEWHGESLKLETKYSAIHLMGKRVQATTSIQLRSKDASTKLETKTVDTPVLQATTSNAYLDVSSHLICNTVDLVASNAYISLSNTVDAPRVSLKTSNAQITASGQIHAEDLLVKTSNARVELKHARILRHVEARTSNANIRANLAGSASDVVSIFTTSNANMDISVVCNLSKQYHVFVCLLCSCYSQHPLLEVLTSRHPHHPRESRHMSLKPSDFRSMKSTTSRVSITKQVAALSRPPHPTPVPALRLLPRK